MVVEVETQLTYEFWDPSSMATFRVYVRRRELTSAQAISPQFWQFQSFLMTLFFFARSADEDLYRRQGSNTRFLGRNQTS